MLKDECRKQEKINGIIYNENQSPDYRHALVNGNIYCIVSGKLREKSNLVFKGNLDYKYHADINDDYVIPDVMVTCDRKHLKGGSYSGVPKFIVETLSPATALRDKTVKKEIYQNDGVAEYWIISPRERAVEIYYLEDGTYKLKYSYILQDDAEEAYYNADTKIVLKEFLHISMTLAEIFENVD